MAKAWGIKAKVRRRACSLSEAKSFRQIEQEERQANDILLPRTHVAIEMVHRTHKLLKFETLIRMIGTWQ